MHHFVRLTALALGLGLAPMAQPAQLCDASGCSITLDFPVGGSLQAPQGATLTFSSGGALQLGSNGSIDPGSGSSTPAVPAGSPAPDMSGGGSIVLGPGGAIHFGTGGSLASGDQGQFTLDDGATLAVSGAHQASISASGDVHLGDINQAQQVDLRSDTSITVGDASTPIDFSFTDGDAESGFSASAGGALTVHDINGANTIAFSNGSGSSSGGGSGGGSSSGGDATLCSGNCPMSVGGSSPSTLDAGSGGGGPPAFDGGSVSIMPADSGHGGAINFVLLLALLTAARLRKSNFGRPE